MNTNSTTGSAEKFALGEVPTAAVKEPRAGYQEREERTASQEADSQQGSDDDDNESSTLSESTWLFRAQYKTDELRKLFNLPESEVRMNQQPAPCPQTYIAWMHPGRALHNPPLLQTASWEEQTDGACIFAECVRRVCVRAAEKDTPAGPPVHL